jgi:periplasmic protein CpxP/Spy
MNEQYKFRNLWFAILSLFMLNIGTLGWIFLKNQHGEPPIGPVIIEESLSFDKKQLNDFEPLKNRHFKEVLPIREDIKKDKYRLFDWLKSEKVDSVALENHLAMLTSKVIANERSTFKHLREIRDLCNPEQRKIFDEVLIEKFKHQGENKNNPPPPPPESK